MRGASIGWGTTVGVAFLTAIAAAAAAVYLVLRFVEWYRLRTHDGGELGYFIIFVPLGFLGGFVAGAIVSRYVPGFWPAQAASLGTVLALCLVIAFLGWTFGEVAPKLDGDELQLQIELKYPPGWQPDSEAKRPEGRSCRLLPIGPGQRTGKPVHGNVLWENAQQVDGQWVVPLQMPLLSSRQVRLVNVTLGQSSTDFNLRLRPEPSYMDTHWSDWIQEGLAPGYAYRSKVQRISEIRDAAAAAETAFWNERDRAAAAIAPDAPIERWLPLFEDPDGTPAAYRWGGADRIERRTVSARVLELGPLLRSTDQTIMRQAVFTLGSLSETPEPLVEPLLVAGRRVPELIKEARTKPAGDKSETRALQYFEMWKNSMDNVHPLAWARVRGILEDIAHEADASNSNGDVAIIARESKEYLANLHP